MGFCPKCKLEYVKDITHCPDCDCDLVDSLTKNNEHTTDFINKNNVNTDEATYDSDNPENFDFESAAPAYVKKADRYADLHSSSIALIIIGALGDIALILNAFGISPIQFEFGSNILFYIVIGSLFTVFLIGGIVSYKKSKIIQNEIVEEENLTKSIKEYISTSFPDEITSLKNISDDNDNEQYFTRASFIKNNITEHFGELNESYLESLTEELYTELFE